jgi:hypothetical protein
MRSLSGQSYIEPDISTHANTTMNAIAERDDVKRHLVAAFLSAALAAGSSLSEHGTMETAS